MRKSLFFAYLGVFTALVAVLRPIGLGAIGVEPMWFALILISRAMGARFGFMLAITSMLFSALISGGMGPWLPGQVIAATVIALGVHLVPRNLHIKVEIASLALYGIVAAEFYGFVLDLFYWPLAIGSGTQLSFDSSIALSENVVRFMKYHFFGALAWDIPRAVLTASLIVATGGPILQAIRRVRMKSEVIERVTAP
jgi:energy-coupling factor transport system substrate-specific component